MAMRRQLLFVLVGVLPSLGASYQSRNFSVEAPTPQIAQQIAAAAEQYRREKALQWLGQEMPPWGEPCPLRVKVTPGGAGGATTFAFDRGQILSQNMHIEGSLDRLLQSVLPHEVTHTVFAYYFRCPVPRWADEGGAVLSEDDVEKNRHDALVRQILNSGREIPLRRLLVLREYPSDVMCLYAEGFSVANFLVASSSRPVFLAFVAHGMQYGWDSAAQTYYHYPNVEALEEAWRSNLRNTRRQPPALLASNTSTADPNHRTIVRLTAPPVPPFAENHGPVFRGQAPDHEGELMSAARPAARPGYLPEYNPSAPVPASLPPPSPPDRWQPGVTEQPAVRLGAPQFLTPSPSPAARQPAPQPISPVGYPY